MQHDNNTVSIGGVDEAGRGSIIGPLVVAGISFKKDTLSELRNMGVKDSKALTPKSRLSLYTQLKMRCLLIHVTLIRTDTRII